MAEGEPSYSEGPPYTKHAPPPPTPASSDAQHVFSPTAACQMGLNLDFD